MKILSLKFKNLNSLRGEFSIDFRNSPLAESGIFAITGPTGAGKTTILDAICVALYGQTPRLNTGNSEELMSRHTGECYAEVEFIVKNEKYRSCWIQRRSRGRSDGRFQASKMELTSLDKGRIIEDKKSMVPGHVEQLTGLDFEQFTRSILLAQGGFAAFLNAKDNDRADLLEKMTGTEIYSLISMKVFEKAKNEQQALKELSIERASLKLMEPEELQKEKDRELQLKNENEKISLNMKSLSLKEKWLKTLEELRSQLETCRQDQINASKERERAAEDLQKLERALKAQPLTGDFEALENVDRLISKIEKEISTIVNAIPLNEAKLQEVENKEAQAQKNYKKFLENLEEKEKLISETIKKDQEIRSENEALESGQKKFDGAKLECDTLKKSQKDFETEIEGLTKCLENAELFLRENSADQELSKDFSLIKERISNLSQNYKSLKQKQGNLKTNKKTQKTIDKKVEDAGRELENARQIVETKKSSKNETWHKLNELLDGKAQSDWEELEKQLTERHAALDKLIDVGTRLSETRTILRELENKRQESETGLRDEMKRREESGEEKLEQESILIRLEQRQNTELLRAKYKEDRKRLEKDKPCPLCGSLEHPWAESSIPDMDKTKTEIAAQKKKINTIHENLKIIEGRISGFKTTAEQCKKDIERQEKSGRELTEVWNQVREKIDLNLIPENWQVIQEQKLLLTENLKESRDIINEIKKIQESLNRLSAEISDSEKEMSGFELMLLDVKKDKEKAEDELKQLIIDQETIQSGIEELEKSITEILKTYNEAISKPGKESELINRLSARNQKYQDSVSLKKDYQEKLIPLENNLSGIKSELKSALRQVEQESENLKKLYEKLTSLKEQRHNLLGEDDPEKVRDSMKKERFRLENDLKKIEEEIANLKADLNTTKGVLLTKNSTLGERKQEHLIAREKFDVRLKDAGFLDYRDFTDAVLGQQRIKELQALKTDLEKRETQIVTRIKDTEQKIAVEMVKKMTESSIEDIQKEIAEQETQQQQIQRQLGAIEATVRQQDILRERQADLIDKISLQQKECTRWNYLNELIGSSDGKKFRRFAQGLTLDNLIGLANRHLLKLNDRYFLKRTENEELGIEVIDTYQADVTRPVSTLSGGEAFLASLALALGLSNIAGRKASIDSFFLDEGFGTLDPETLEVALAALDSLHASGKTIGIISHVEAIKERIPVQIMVRKLSGGVSTLEISG